jgi:hypothetical protein
MSGFFCAFSLLSLFAPGYAFLMMFAPFRRLSLGVIETFLAGSILSLSILITPLVIVDWTLQIPLLKWSIYSYAALVAVASVLLLIRSIRHWRQTIQSIGHFATDHAWLILIALGTGMAWIALLIVPPTAADWDGNHQYLREGILYSQLLRLPSIVPEPYAQPGLLALTNPPLQPVLYAYGLQAQQWLIGYSDYKLLSIYNLAMLAGIGGALYAFTKRYSLPKGVIALSLFIWATYPSTLEVLQTAFLSLDIPYAFFSLAALYFAVRAFESSQGQWFYWVLAALGCGLSFMAKIQGPLTVMLIGLIAGYYVLPRFFRLAFSVLLTGSLVFVFFRLTPALFQLVMSWHFALSIGLMGLMFALFYGSVRPQVTPKNWKTLLGMAFVFVVLFSLSALYMYRSYSLLGSAGGWYTSSLVKGFTPNFEWARSIDVEGMAFQIWRAGGGARPGLPQLRDLTPFIGYDWNPTLLIFAILGTLTLLRNDRLSTIRLVVAFWPITVLAWWLALGMDLTRQFLVVLPSLAILQALGIERVLNWVTPHVTMAGCCAYTALVLAFSSPFWMPFLNNYIQIFSPLFSLTTWKGSSNWLYYTPESLKQVIQYVFAVDAVAMSILPFRHNLAWLSKKLHHMVGRVAAISAMVIFWGIMVLPTVNVVRAYGVSEFQMAYTEKVYDGFIPALRAAEALHPEAVHSVIMTYREFALPAFTEFRRIGWNIADPVRNGYYRELLTARNMTQVIDMLRQEGVKAAILPADESSYRYNLYRQTRYQETDLPLLWLIVDSGVFPAGRVGNWNVIDIGNGLERFAGTVTVLMETDYGRGRIYRKVEGLRYPTARLSVTPVIDVSGLLPNTQSVSLPDAWRITTNIELRLLYYDGANWSVGQTITQTIETHDVLNMPSFDLQPTLDSFKTRLPGFRYYGVQIESIHYTVYGDRGEIMFRGNLDSKPHTDRILAGYTDTGIGEWVPYPTLVNPGRMPNGTNVVYDEVTGKWQIPADTNPLFNRQEDLR